MRKILYTLMLCSAFVACGESAQQQPDLNQQDSGMLIEADTAGDNRGARGAGTDNTGGTPGPGTITDTGAGKVDTLDHRDK